MLSGYEIPMIARRACSRPLPRAAVAIGLLVAGIGLSGCADLGDSFASGAFADPAKYEYYDCKQLEDERKSLAARSAELQGLMAKADTGVAGPVVAELAYRNDYISVRAQAKLAEEGWRRNKCHELATGCGRGDAGHAACAAASPEGRAVTPAVRQRGLLNGAGAALTVASHKSSPVAPAAAFRRSP